MNDYSMSADLFRQRAIEIGAGLVKGMNFDGVHVSLTEEQRRFVQSKIQDGQFRR